MKEKKHETNRKDSQNTSLILRTKTFTLDSEMMTSRHTHTQTMPTLPASAVWGIYGPLCALIHTHDTHTHSKHKGTHRSVCSLGWSTWFERRAASDTSVRRCEKDMENRSDSTHFTHTDSVCLTIFNIYISIFMYLLCNGFS